jgi:putative MFS transporter
MSSDKGNQGGKGAGLIPDEIYMVQRLDRMPFNIFFVYLALITGFGLFFDIYDIDTMSITAPIVAKLWHLTPLEVTLSIAWGFIGMFVGSLVSGRLADALGRRSLFMLTLAIIAIGALWSGLSPNLLNLWASRFVTGFGIGGDLPVVWAYLTEMSPTRYRGRLMGIAMIIGVASLPAVGLLASYFISTFGAALGWRYVFLSAVVIAILVWVIRYFAPESPRYYLAHNMRDKAEEVMRHIEAYVERVTGKKLPPYDTSKKYMLGEYRAPLKEIFTRKYAIPTTTATLLWIFQTWGFYGFTAFLPLILIAKGFTFIHAIYYTAIGWVGGILGPIIIAAIGERFERKYALMLWAGLAALFMIVMGVTPITLPILIIISAFLVNTFIQAWATHLYAYVPELFPSRARATGGGFANAMGRGFNVIGLMVVGVLLAGLPLYQLTFTALSWIVCIIVLAILGTKTSGRVLEEISEK